jgi:hypothetical protein
MQHRRLRAGQAAIPWTHLGEGARSGFLRLSESLAASVLSFYCLVGMDVTRHSLASLLLTGAVVRVFFSNLTSGHFCIWRPTLLEELYLRATNKLRAVHILHLFKVGMPLSSFCWQIFHSISSVFDVAHSPCCRVA